MNTFVATQPIFDRDKAVFGYELLFRSGLENSYGASEPDRATVDVVANSLLDIGLDDLTDGRLAFINFTRSLLVQGVPSLLPPDRVAVEILEDIQPDEEVLGACGKLKETGYTLAMDDFVANNHDSPLLKYADIVKVDFLGTKHDDRRGIRDKLAARGITVLAEKVETIEDFQRAHEWGYSLFQGYFFSKPVVKTGQRLSGNKLTYLQLLQEVNRPDLSYEEMEAVIKRDVSLTYRLLRFINSAWFALKAEVTSIRHALILLGPREIRKWFALVGLSHVAGDKPQELVLRAVARARAAELLAPLLGMEAQASELFLLGMFSMLDALTDSPMPQILDKLPLREDMKKALLGEKCPLRTVLETIVSYERGLWDSFSQCATSLKVDESGIPEMYSNSLKWARNAFSAM